MRKGIRTKQTTFPTETLITKHIPNAYSKLYAGATFGVFLLCWRRGQERDFPRPIFLAKSDLRFAYSGATMG